MQASSSKSCNACRLLLPARGVAAVGVAIRFASASTIRCCAAVGSFAALRMRHTPCGCRSAHLVEVHSNHRLPKHSTMRRAPAMPLFRTQSAAKQTSLAPHDSKARLQNGHEMQGFMAKPCTPHPHCAARAVIQAKNCQCAGSRGKPPLPFSGGSKGGVLFGKRIPPLLPPPAGGIPLRAVRGKNHPACKATHLYTNWCKTFRGALCQKNS